MQQGSVDNILSSFSDDLLLPLTGTQGLDQLSQDLFAGTTESPNSQWDPTSDGERKKRKLATSPLIAEMDSDDEEEDSSLKKFIAQKFGSFEKRMKKHLQEVKTENSEALSTITKSLNELTVSLNHQSTETEHLKKDNAELTERIQIMEGRLFRAEKVIGDLSEKQVQMEARSMRDNLVFYNIPENKGEKLMEVLYDFLKKNMKIPDEQLKKIQFERIHRMGQKSVHTRPIVAKVLNSSSVGTVFRHAKNLDKKFGVSVQLPPELNERKKSLLPIYKHARSEKKPTTWIVDKLVVDGKTHAVAKDTVRDINLDITAKASEIKVTKAPSKPHEGSVFQGSRMKIEDYNDVVPALHALYKDTRVARATHNIYAYRLVTSNGIYEHYEDDGEYGAGNKILDILRRDNITNELVCVTRWYGGKHLGPARFNLIREAVETVLKL